MENKEKNTQQNNNQQTETAEQTKNGELAAEEENYENKTKILQELLELEENEAEKALELADGEVDKAKEMVDFVEKCYTIIHGKLNYGGYNKTYGLFYLIVDGKNGDLLREDSLLNNNNDLWNVNLEVSNKAFAKTLSNYNSLQGESLKLDKNLSPAEIFDLYKFTKNGSEGEVRAILEDKLEEELEVAIELTVHSEVKTKTQLENMYSSLFADDSTEEDETESDSNEDNNSDLGLDLTLKCLPVVSPTQGKRATNLNPGERLLVKIVDDTELGHYFRNLLSNDSGLTTGIIEEINLRPALSNYNIKIRFGPDIYGEVVIGTEIKIVSNPDKEALKEERKVEGQQNSNSFNPLLLILLGTIIVLIIILVSLYV